MHDLDKGKEIRGIPITFAVKGARSIEGFETFAGVGLGLYVTEYRGYLSGVPIDDGDVLFGGHLLFGMNLNILSPVFIAMEGRYVLTEEAEYNGVHVDLNGFAAMIGLGIKF